MQIKKILISVIIISFVIASFVPSINARYEVCSDIKDNNKDPSANNSKSYFGREIECDYQQEELKFNEEKNNNGFFFFWGFYILYNVSYFDSDGIPYIKGIVSNAIEFSWSPIYRILPTINIYNTPIEINICLSEEWHPQINILMSDVVKIKIWFIGFLS